MMLMGKNRFAFTKRGVFLPLIIIFSLGIFSFPVFSAYAAVNKPSLAIENAVGNIVHNIEDLGSGYGDGFRLIGEYVVDALSVIQNFAAKPISPHLAAAAEISPPRESFWCWLQGLIGLDCAPTSVHTTKSDEAVLVPKSRSVSKPVAPLSLLSDTPELSIPDSVALKNPPPQNKILSFESIVASLKTVFAPISALGTLEYRIGALERNTGGKNVSDPEARNGILALQRQVDSLRVSGNPNFSPGVSYAPAGIVGGNGNAVMFGVSAPTGFFNESVTANIGTFTGAVSAGSFNTSGSFTATGSFTAGSALYVDATNGRVGIGTSTPTDTLSLNGAAFLAPITPAQTVSRLYNNGGNLFWSGSLIGGASTGNWTTDGTHAWRATGNVGIGTTSPYAKLSIIANQTDTNSTLFAIASSTSGTATTTLFSVNSAGGVGIGTAPSAGFSLAAASSIVGAKYQASNNGAANAPAYVFSSNNTTGLFAVTGGNLGFSANGAEGMRLISGGNLGIGTTSPYAKLTVVGEVVGANFTATSTTATSTFAGRMVMSGLGTPQGNAVCITATGEVTNPGAASCTGSSERFKENIETLSSGFALDELRKFNVVSFDYTAGNYSPEDQKGSYGLIAEEVEKVDPKLVDYGYDGKPLTLKFEKFIGLLVQGVQELLARVTGLEDEMHTQKLEIENQKSEINALKARMNALDLPTMGTQEGEQIAEAVISTPPTAPVPDPTPASEAISVSEPTPATSFDPSIVSEPVPAVIPPMSEDPLAPASDLLPIP